MLQYILKNFRKKCDYCNFHFFKVFAYFVILSFKRRIFCNLGRSNKLRDPSSDGHRTQDDNLFFVFARIRQLAETRQSRFKPDEIALLQFSAQALRFSQHKHFVRNDILSEFIIVYEVLTIFNFLLR